MDVIVIVKEPSPGPWRIGEYPNQIVDLAGEPIGLALTTTEGNVETNALLMASAHELLKLAEWFCSRVESGEVRSVATYGELRKIVARVRGEVTE